MSQPTLAGSRIPAGGLAVAVALSAANVLGYLFNLIASRALGPKNYGAVAALLGLVLIGNVVALAVQAVVARRAAAGDRTVVGWATRLGVLSATIVAAVATLSAPLVTNLLHLPSAASALWLAAALAPLTLIGGALGVLQGLERFPLLAVMYLVAGLGKVGGGVVGVLATDSVSGAMAGTAIGTAAAAVVGYELVRQVRRADPASATAGWRPPPAGTGREVVHATYALGAFFALTNIDVVLARHFLDARDAGLYAVGAVVAKGAFWLPSVVPVVAMPGLSDPTRRRRTAAVALSVVLASGAIVVVGAAVAGSLLVRIVGGSAYLGLSDYVWVFAATGAVLAVAQLLLYSRLAAEDRRAIIPLWLLVVTEVTVVSLWWHGSALQIVSVALACAVSLCLLGAGAEAQEHGVLGGARARRRRRL